MRIPKEEYNKAVGCLKRYNYNCIKIMDIRENIMSISGQNLDGMPKAKYNTSDIVINSVIQLQTNEELKKASKELKAVQLALELVDEDSKKIFEKVYRQSKSKWETIKDMNMSEETYKRKKSSLIYAVYNELEK